ncbi:MAG: mannose-1-phosphate guanylyltransferase/mannose-6-phosphate isomerase [Paracoccaceae bacterium]|nr:mannose-1-phosphate guanylyltransferase/mannose-6-phosphate isomerase [Paracoccaceae bacterium]MDG2257912.1 mannose-1-phosphate guanylyltransferase/mannose-6-phosphate isomerase [Paracoccaceae bacterium]
MPKLFPVILCGGSGTRLWPLSRKSFPKQFVKLVGEETLYQASASRLTGTLAGAEFQPPVIMTNADFRFIVVEQLQDIGIDPGAVIIEPSSRNTGPAVLAAAKHAAKEDPDAMVLIAPSDHVMNEPASFRKAVERGIQAAQAGNLVTFGIQPTKPETGFGYLKLGDAPDENGAATPLDAFVEKPDPATAQKMIDDGNYLWNAGIFLFRAKDIVAAFETHAAELTGLVEKAIEQAQTDLGFLRLAEGPWNEIEDISIDYAVMEKAENLSVVPYSGMWSDLGSWTAVHELSQPDADGVATAGNVTAIDCKNSLLRSENEDQELVGLGVENLIAISMPDAVLIADMSRGQDVKQAVNALKAKGASQAELLPVDFRPWGHFETLVLADRFQVKRIVVKPGAALSLQSHHHRAEHWIVVQGTAKVTVNEDIKLLSENQSVYIPLGAVHRMENPGKVDMVLIEVQTGSYLGEDDIIRYEDVYARGQGAKG